MQARDWIVIVVAALTLASSWGQFWVKERLFSNQNDSKDPVIAVFKSKWGIAFIALTGIFSAVSIWLLVFEITSPAPLTRMAVFKISTFCMLTYLNVMLVQAIYTLRRLASLRTYIDFKHKQSSAFTFFMR